MRENTYQTLLILSGVLVTSLFGVFLYREIFPEYKIYQNNYIALEEFRSTYTHQLPPPFQMGVKQIVIEREDRGPATIDRCTSCHVALQVPYFSPTKIARDLNGNIVRNASGHPVLVPNEDFIWQKLDEKIAELRDEKVLEHLQEQGERKEINRRLTEANKYEALKTAHVGDQVYDVTKVLVMHPLMGNETYPFQFHPIEEYGCTSCHNGNGRGLTTDKAHGPVFDGQYGVEAMHSRQFTQPDPKNDPRFAHVFNHKPNDDLIFQTEPIYVGSLIQARCVQCHQTSGVKLTEANQSVSNLALLRQRRVNTLTEAFENEKQTLFDLLYLSQSVENKGYAQTLKQLQVMEQNYALPALKLEHVSSQLKYLEQVAKGEMNEEKAKQKILTQLNQDLVTLLGSHSLAQIAEKTYLANGEEGIENFLKEYQQFPEARGILFAKGEALDLNQDLMRHAQEAQQSFSKAVGNTKLMSALTSDVDELTQDFQRGKDLYISQACYACHRISGFSRGGVGPELTRAAEHYPWYLKRKLSWPQGDLPTSTMPNMHFDSRELEHLMTFLLAQRGNNRAVARTTYQSDIQAWEAGRKVEWEKPIPPAQIYDLRYSQMIFATEGCAACHRLRGFESNVGFTIEKEKHSIKELHIQQHWFRKLFPEVVHFSHFDEELPGSEIVAAIDNNVKEIDERIVDNVRKNSILEEINANHHEMLESLYSPFRYAARAKNNYYQNLIENETDPAKIAQLNDTWNGWKNRVHRVLMMYIQIYGLGRLIGPHLNWSGIYRSDEWLMEHFRNPPAHVPRSLMPVFPFDDTKFYALTHLLNVMAVRNRDNLRQLWKKKGFDPKEAYDMLCAQCHGIGMIGNGVIAEWIYPIPKNLHNPEFLRNLTKERAMDSIRHGIRGTPMPPWGEVSTDKSSDIKDLSNNIPVMNESEIRFLIDWIFTGLSGGRVIRKSTDVPKWQYSPEDVLKELKKEGGKLIPEEKKELQKENEKLSFLTDILSSKMHYASFFSPEVAFKAEEKNQNQTVEDVFNIVSNPNHPDETDYYIKQKFYTPENIEAGQNFFLINCSVCHGNEGDGTGTRSQAMQEAKPRMLTNLDWINSHDDMRLLRSIKYGVPGTSMTPWGDLTSSLQRLQLVMFIRSLTREREQRTSLSEALYHVFDSAQLIVDNARIELNQQIENLRSEKERLTIQQADIERKVRDGRANPQAAVKDYQKNLEIDVKIKYLLEKDEHLNLMKAELRKERELYNNIGISLISKDISEEGLKNYLELIRLNKNRFEFKEQKLQIHHDDERKAQMQKVREKLVNELDKKIAELERQQKILEGRISSAKQREELNFNRAEIEGYKKLKAKLITDTEEAWRLAAGTSN